MLIDAGDNSKGTAVQQYLLKQGIETLAYVIGTHPDADHVGGLDVIISKFDCEYRATRRDELTRLLKRHGCSCTAWKFPEETGFYQPIVIARKDRFTV